MGDRYLPPHKRKNSSKFNADNNSKNNKNNNNNNDDDNVDKMTTMIDGMKVIDSSENTIKSTDVIRSCIICANDKVDFYAVGPCNHHVCSVCSLRLRSKSHDKNCALCKQYLEYVIIYRSNKGIKLFDTFRVDGLDCQSPDIQVDHSSSTVYHKCKDHYKDMENMRSILCPIKKCNKTIERFTTEDLLLNHLKTVHQLTFCKLCLTHRPLFISEQKLMTDTELQKHIKKTDASGHPICQFCSQNFFDTNQLFTHLRTDHPICHLCPQQYQHRYYRNMEFLWDHLCGSHIICEHCNIASNGIVTEDLIVYASFNSHGDYVDHLTRAHGISRSSQSTQNLLGFQYQNNDNTQIQKKKGRNFNAAPYIDMDISPNLIPANRTRSNRHNNPTAVRQDTADLFVIPDGMRVAGRITGTGRFRRGEEDELLQQAAEYNAALINATDRRGSSSSWSSMIGSNRIGSRGDDQFPQLAASTDNKQSDEGANKEPHPLSVMNSKQQMAEALKRAEEKRKIDNQKEAEERKLLRNARMAEALGLAESKELTESENILMSPEMISNYSNELQRPLYPPLLITYASKEKLEIAKLEKHINNMMVQKDINSIQLKPMPSATRYVIHCYAKYHQFNSYEYDPEPRRYVSLVKNPTSTLPTPISKLCSLGVFQIPSNQKDLNQPVLYFMIKPHPTLFTQTIARDLSKDWAILTPTIAMLIGRIQNVLLSHGFGKNTTRIVGFKSAGANGVALEFPSVNDAAQVFYYITQEKEDIKVPRIFDLFQVEPAFNETLVLQEIGLIKVVTDETDPSDKPLNEDFCSEENSNVKAPVTVDKDGFMVASTKRKGKKGMGDFQRKDDKQTSIPNPEKEDINRPKIQQPRFISWDSDDDEPIASKYNDSSKDDDKIEVDNSMFWTCSQCTYVNEFVSSECLMCYNKKDDSW